MRGGGAPTLEARTVTPSTSQQIIKPSRDEYDGLSQVTVEATPLETRTVNPSTSSQTVTPSGGNIGFSTVMVNPYRLQSKSVTPSTSSQTVSPDSGYNGLSSVSVGAVSLQSKTVSPNTSSQTVKPSSGYTGLSQVTVNAANLQNKTVTPSSSTQYISADSGYYGLRSVTVSAISELSSGIKTMANQSIANIQTYQTTINFPYNTDNLASFYMYINTYNGGILTIYGDFTLTDNYGALVYGEIGRVYEGTCSRSGYQIIISHTAMTDSLAISAGANWTIRCTFI